MNNQEKQTQHEIASHIGRLLREAFGKGPQSIYVSINRPFVVIYLRNFLSPTEKILLQQGHVYSVQQTRSIVMETLIPEIKAYLQLLTGMNMQEFYFDWGLHNYSGVFVGIASEENPLSQGLQEWCAGKKELHVEIERISLLIQKIPDNIQYYLINERTILVVKSGIMISIAKELIRLGFEDNLKIAQRNLEKKYLFNNNQFQKIVKSPITDIFTDWNFHLDKSVIVFILNPIHD
ncbi:DUF2294 domain-containing protein [Paenibacillus oryzisoli]|uniref:Na+-translocating membrane potential-generating system MpsC domain-containing protein n=1 Tax=Paenibacillus oryzisoli TaxID=1850517 RepID=A0A198AA24_9BACL|nr:Na-translocating system protein MpsC family protein [Paenibacillus oryzisoli]OAS17808.1 hypothetical protein A8708_27680 [Paenibacillus oryzisoli]